MGKDWEIDTPALIPPPPLRGFKELAHLDVPYETDDENDAWKRGEVDARECVHCNQMTYAHHTTTLMQSNFKAKPPSFIEEIERDLRVATQAANHIIFMGYSLPPDDVAYRAFLSARKQRPNKNNQVLRCSVVVGQGLGERWMYPQDIDEIMEPKCADKSPHHTTLESARDIFGRDNVRFYGHGIPQVFCMHNQVSRQAFQKLFNWEETT